MYNVLIIGLGGFVGAILRYFVSGWVQNGFVSYPFGTLSVNFIGSFFLSLIMSLSEYKGIIREDIRIFLTVGLLGAFTTMSTFSYESFKLMENKETLLFGINIISTIALTLIGVYIGRMIALHVSEV